MIRMYIYIFTSLFFSLSVSFSLSLTYSHIHTHTFLIKYYRFTSYIVVNYVVHLNVHKNNQTILQLVVNIEFNMNIPKKIDELRNTEITNDKYFMVKFEATHHPIYIKINVFQVNIEIFLRICTA